MKRVSLVLTLAAATTLVAQTATAQTLKTIGTLVQDNPKQAALIVRDWLTSGA